VCVCVCGHFNYESTESTSLMLPVLCRAVLQLSLDILHRYAIPLWWCMQTHRVMWL